MDNYYKTDEGKWAIVLPNGNTGVLSPAHKVVEHSDGTISVWPSIYDTMTGWHGWLLRGEFTERYHG